MVVVASGWRHAPLWWPISVVLFVIVLFFVFSYIKRHRQ
jgi:hypothetical protein